MVAIRSSPRACFGRRLIAVVFAIVSPSRSRCSIRAIARVYSIRAITRIVKKSGLFLSRDFKRQRCRFPLLSSSSLRNVLKYGKSLSENHVVKEASVEKRRKLPVGDLSLREREEA